MNKLTYLLIATLLAFALPAAMATDFYVSPDGNDAWSGKLARPNAAHTDGPLASLLGAGRDSQAQGRRDAVGADLRAHCKRPLCRQRAAGVRAAGFRHVQFPITYRGDPGNRPILCGGREITGWTKQGDRWVATFPTWQPASGPSPRCGWTASAGPGADAERGPLLLHRREGPAAYGPENRQAHGQQPACLSLQSARHSAAEQSR